MDFEGGGDRQSKFNAGVALAERIDGLQRALNMARFNPLRPNEETLTFNYEIMISANEGLLSEAWSKLNTKEKELGLRISETVREFIKHYPPTSLDKSGNIKINKDNYERFLELINYWEKKNKEFLDNHSFNSPDFEDDEGL